MEQWLRADRRLRIAVTAMLLLLIGGALTSAGVFSPRFPGPGPQNGSSLSFWPLDLVTRPSSCH
jgi:hypothetical protein